ncbi:MAG TPA: Flp pilus assembly protein CpaB [Acidobacteriota bacterium]|nr:Flp pilus assembly protein CpaB [Acidobacteriota bacterium]
MSRIKLLITAVVALGLAALATLLVYRQLEARLTANADEMLVVVAREDIPVGTMLNSQHVRLATWPKDMAMEGSFSDLDAVLERGVVLPIQANEPLLESKLAAKGAGAGLVSTIPNGMRAVSVKVDEVIGVAGFVLPGTHVDVILSGSPNEQRNIEMSRVFLENVRVLAAGQNIEHEAEGAAQRVQVITLLVTPKDAQKLALAANDGKIQLALRNPLDREEDPLEAVHKRVLYEGEKKEEPKPPAPKTRLVRSTPRPKPEPKPEVVAPPPPQTFEVELITGSKRETLEFQEKKDEKEKSQKKPQGDLR